MGNLSIGVGATEELSLRVSVATLSRVVFKHPQESVTMLALERTATFQEQDSRQRGVVKAQPFGGAVRLHHPGALREFISGFHFDSEHSRAEGDFRLQIRPSDWAAVKQFCRQHFQDAEGTNLESNPIRELAEEFTDALGVRIMSAQYVLRPLELVIEHDPTRTGNVHAADQPTARIYQTFEVRLVDPTLVAAILASSNRYSTQDFQELALKDMRNGGKGRANAVLALPLDVLTKTYLAMPPAERNSPICFRGNRLAGNVPAILENVFAPKYRRLEREYR